MTRTRGMFAALVSLMVIGVSAQAATTDFRVLFDTDNNAATGCVVAGMPGVDLVFRTQVTTTDTSASVTRTSRQVCTIGSLGPELNVDTTVWPAALQPASGSLGVESMIPFEAFGGAPGDMRIGVQGTNGAAVHTAVLRPDGSPVVWPAVHGKRRSVGAPGPPRVITLDGLDSDWFGISPLMNGIAGGGTAGIRILKVSTFGDVITNRLYFFFDANISTDAPFAADDDYVRDAGSGLTVPAPGVLANDGDPNGLPITATPVSAAEHGDVTLNPDGSFTYTPDDPDSTDADEFEYKATNGTKDSSPARVRISVNAEGNDAPTFTSASAVNVQENTTAVMALSATDPEGDTVTFSITGGADAARFTISSGNLRFVTAPNFENPSDADDDNVYLVSVTADDGNGGTDTVGVTVTVTNENEEPEFTSAASATIPEGQTDVLTVTVDDPDGDTIVFSITGGADAGDFDINSATGELSFNPAPNFEAPGDANADNVYTVTVDAEDGANTISQTITVTVTDVNEGPAFTTGTAFSVAENTTAVTTVAATDPEGTAATFSIVGGADAADFSINATTGALAFNSAPNFEAPADADSNNVYVVQVRASDGTNTTNQTIAVTVTDINEAPAFTSGNAFPVPENTTAAFTAAAGDPDGDALTFSISGGADAADFSINATTGAVTFTTAPNFEAPADADANNVYTVQVSVTDGANSVNLTVNVTVADANEAPLFTSGNTASVSENTTAVTTVTAADPEGDAVTFSITGGADAAGFSINATTGALSFNSAPDFEAPADADANNLYLVQVTANDGTSNVSQTISVTVTNVDEAPVFTSGTTSSVPENTLGAYTAVTTDAEGDAIAYSITGGADAADFSINATSGAVTFNATPNFEAPADADANNGYTIQITADDGTNSTVITVVITVTNVNDAPVITSANAPSVVENTTAVLTVTTSDEDGDAVTYSITGGADAADFSINATTGALTFNAAPDFEAPADADANNTYIVQVTANDGTDTGVQTITVTVTNDNEAPVFSSGTAPSVAENTTVNVMTVVASDPEGVAVTYSISGGADAADFSINASTGALTFNVLPNFEAPADADANNQYIVQVTASDGSTTTNQTITVTVTDANDAPVITSGTTANAAENQTAAQTATATDEDGDTVTWSITGGADAADFSINASTGALTFVSAPNFEAPADADANNVYVLQLTVSDGSATASQTVSVTVTNVNEAPVFTSANSNSVAENNTAAHTVVAVDPESLAVTYALTGGADMALFSVNAATGALTFNAAPDFEAPADADTNNTYEVQVTAFDGVLNTPQNITITVTDANEAPSITSTNANSVLENTLTAHTITATDPEGDTLTFSITGGADAADFSIDPNTGVLTFNTAPDFENPADADTDNQYVVTVEVTDGTSTTSQTVTITVTDVNEAPEFTSANDVNVAEGNTAVLTVTTTDPEGDTVTYSITGGADAGDFSIDTNTGALTFTVAPNFEAPADADADNEYLIEVTANDGTNDSVQTITVHVTDNNEAPSITSANTAAVPENTTAVLTATATDQEGNTITWSITGGADAGVFAINATTGALSFNALPDFESPGDNGLNNEYLVEITANDGTNSTAQTITVTVTDVNEAPSITSPNTASVAENTTAVLTAASTDPETDTITWSIVGGADAGDFSIDPNTGALTFGSAPDFEAPADADTNNQYLVTIRADDGTNDTDQTITVTVTNANEAPSITSGNAASAAENQTGAIDVDAADPDAGAALTFSITGGADAGDFNIVAGTGVLTFASAPDFESPADADTNNQYVVEVTVSDGSLTDVQTITITVTNANEAPSITTGNTASVAENQTAVTDVDATDVDAGATLTFSISGGADAADFGIVAGTGVLTFNSAPDFETPGDADGNNQYVVEVTVSDGSLTDVQTITVTVTNANEGPSITSGNAASVAENQTGAIDVDATDPDASASLTFSISGGADSGDFSIDGGTGVLTFASAPDFESPADADTNNQYVVEVTVSDGSLTDVQTITITVTDANEAPSITTGNTASVAENTTAVTDVDATDVDAGATLTFSISGGADAADFGIVAGTGVLTFNSAPNFEAPADADGDNQYVVEVTVSDGSLTDVQTITVTVTDANEAPSITSSATPSAAENQTTAVDVNATDPDAGATLTYSITGGADQLLFSIDTNTGLLTFNSAPDFETPADADADNGYVVEVTATDGTNPVTQTITVSVTSVNEAPSITTVNTASVSENTVLAIDVDATDADAGTTLTFSITGGADAGDFSINGSTGALSFNPAPDFENPADADTNNEYIVEVMVSDGSLTDVQTITVTVTSVNEAPSFTSANTANVPENTTAVHTVTTTDPENDTVTYSITGGADAADFTIDPNTGALAFASAPDFEAPADADTDNVYVVEVTANDGTNNAAQTISVTVQNGNELPTFTSTATPSVAENLTAAITVTTSDVENDTITYSITGGADAADFSIDSNTGALTFNVAPNFEAPHDADANNAYLVDVTANDGTGNSVQNLSVTVTNVNEAPVFATGNSFTQAENITAVTTVTANDPESAAVTYSVTGGADSGDFTIDTNTGALSFTTAPDFDVPGDTGANNVYNVEVTATDGTTPVAQAITVTITNVDEGPTFTSSATPSVPENMTTAVDVDATDPEGAGVTYSIVGGADQADFSIDSSTGVLTFSVAPNFELPHDADTNNIYVVDVQATDGVTPTVQNLSVTVTNVDEAPSITTANTANVAENTSAVIDVDATDPDAGATLTYSIVAGGDSAAFSIVSGTGVLTFASAPNFEAPTDAGTNNVYNLDVQVTDGTNPVTQSITVTVTDVNEAPSITSANTANVAENSTTVITVTSTDPEGTTPTYSITGGADQGDFTINATSGELTFTVAPNFESPADADTNNVYIVQVTATDGTNQANQTITVTVTNVNEAPVNSVPGAQTTLEDTNLVFSSGNGNQISISDPDGDVNVQVTLSATNGTLSTNGTTGLTFTVGDGTADTTMTFTGTVSTINLRLNGLTFDPDDNYYSTHPVSTDTVSITTNDQGNTGSGSALQDADTIAMDVNPVNDAPTTPSYTVALGTAHVTHSGLGITIAATDSNELKEDSADVDDHDPYSELTVQIVGGTLSPANATLTLNDASTGAFYFEPPGGLSGSGAASFQYQVCDNGDATLGLAPQCSAAATVQFTITGPDTWYVDDAPCGGVCNGSRTKPLSGLNNAALVGRGTGDRIFVASGTYNHGFTMNASEHLISEATAGLFDTHFGVVVPGNGTLDTRPALAGAAVTLQNTLTAANSTTVRGVTLSTGVNKGYVANANTLTVSESSVTAANTAVEITNGTGSSIGFTSTTSTGGTHGINLTNVSGTFGFGSGALTNNTLAGFALAQNAANVANVTFSGNINPTAAGRAVDIGTAVASSGMRGGTIGLSGSIGNVSASHSGIRVRNSTAGTLNLTGATYAISSLTANAVELTTNPGATINFNPGTSITINTTTGRGFLASGGGTINVTGDNNTITTTNGGAFEVFGTAGVHMGGGYNWKSITATNGTDGISLQFHDGPFTVTGDGPDGGTAPDSVTAGGTITGSDQRGAEFIDVDGPVSLNGMTFTNPADTAGPDATNATGTCGSVASGGSNSGCFAGIHFDTSSNVSLNTINVTGSGQMGINVNAVSNLTMNTVTINNAGTSAQEDALRLYNLSGTGGSITNLSIDNPFAMGINLENTNVMLASEASPFLITNATITDSAAAQGAVFHTVNSGVAHVKFVGGTISGHFSVGIQTSSDVGATGTLGVYVDGTQFSNVAGAIHLQAGGGTHKFDIRNINMVARASGASHSIMLKADSSGILEGKVYSNTIGNTTAYSGAPSGSYPISVDARNSSTITAQIRGNTLRHADAGVEVGGGQGSSRVNLTITGNRILDPEAATALAGIYANSGILGTDSSCMTIQIGGLTAYPGSPSAAESEIKNQIEGSWPSASIRVIKSFGGSPPDPVFNLPGYDGSGVNAWIAARNTFVGAGTTVSSNAGAGGAFTGAAVCP